MTGDQQERLKECESLRGIAITLVFFYHFLGSLRGYAPDPNAHFATALLFGGSTGVDLFFVLSGFLLSLPYFRGSPIVLRQFFANRALRILPMYYLMVLIGAAWSGDWHAVVHAALFLDIGLNTLSPFGLVWWSLAVEVQFYLVLPALVYLARMKWGRYLLAGVLLCLCFCYLKTASPSAPEFWAAQRNSLLGRWPQFAVGIAAAWVHHRYGTLLRSMSEQQRQWLGTLVALAALAALDVITVHGLRLLGSLQHVYWYKHYLYASILWAVFLIAVIDLQPVFHKLVVNPLLHRIGLWSYSIYLVHVVFIVFAVLRLGLRTSDAQMTDHLTNIMLFIYIVGASLLVSATTYHLIERPFLRLKRGKFLSIGQIREDVM
jgi:peptidoglycan/LPS O-acetylase OafA/YrhL